MRRSRITALGLAALGVATATTAGAATHVHRDSAAALPPVRHVFVIELENKGFDETFGAGAPAYLASTLPSQGALLTQYYGIGHESLDNYIAQVSGQAPNMQTQADCQRYVDVEPGLAGPDGQTIGQGCVYPAATLTIADQLAARGLTWHGYMEDMGNDAGREPARCGAPGDPTPPGSADDTQSATPTDMYAARHNPFAYFHSLLDSGACARNVTSLAPLATDLQQVRTTANFTWITPNLCDDGHDAPCADGRPGGLVSANEFLRRWVPLILASPAYRKDGLLVVTFDEADGTSDASSCCGEAAGYNTPMPGITGPGGGCTGAVLLSRWIRPGTRSATPYDHYSMLRSWEDLFGVTSGGADGKGHLGYAGQAGLQPLGRDVFTAW
jgi:hypothetical protein